MPKTIRVECAKTKDCKHSVVFSPTSIETPENPHPFTGVYISRLILPNNGKGVEKLTITIELPE